MKISIIIPVYNVENYITDTLLSVINQNNKEFELILIDDGTTDNSAIIAEKLLMSSDLDYHIIHTKNRGVSAARNTGILKASGDYIIMVDSDDILATSFLSEYYKLITLYPFLNIYSTGYSVVSESNCMSFRSKGCNETVNEYDQAQLKFLKRNLIFLLPTMLFKRDFLISNSIYFDESVKYSEDVQFIWRALAYNRKKVVHRSVANYNYILHPGSTMTSSGYKKILTGYQGIIRLNIAINHLLITEIKESFVPTWIFAMMHSSAKLLSFSNFSTLCKEVCAKENLRCLAKYGLTTKTRLIASIFCLFPHIGYYILKTY